MKLKYLAISLFMLTLNSTRIHANEIKDVFSLDDNPYRIMQHFHEAMMKEMNSNNFFKNYESRKMLTDVKQKKISLNIYA